MYGAHTWHTCTVPAPWSRSANCLSLNDLNSRFASLLELRVLPLGRVILLFSDAIRDFSLSPLHARTHTRTHATLIWRVQCWRGVSSRGREAQASGKIGSERRSCQKGT